MLKVYHNNFVVLLNDYKIIEKKKKIGGGKGI